MSEPKGWDDVNGTAHLAQHLPSERLRAAMARIEALQAEVDRLREALEDVLGVGFDAPMTWTGTDAEWERRRANAMQAAARRALIGEAGE